MRALSLRAAQNCENALKPRCHCRCGGQLHGARRLERDGATLPEREDFEQLPADDPHHLPTEAERKAKREAAKSRAAKRRALLRRLEVANLDVKHWRAWSGPNAPLPQRLTNELAEVQAALQTMPGGEGAQQ